MLIDQSFISIIIPAFKSAQLPNTLQALTRQTSLDLIKEIIIVGQQEVPECTSIHNIRYIHVENLPTIARNRNIGARSASGSWLVYTDSDCLPEPNWIEQLAAAIAPNDLVLAGAVEVPANMTYWGMCDHYLGFGVMAKGIANSPSIPYAATLNFAIKRSFLIELGGFNEAFQRGSEDRELCWRITQRGVKIRFVPQAIVIHDHGRRTFTSAARHIYYYGVDTGQFRMLQHDSLSIFRRIGIQIVKIPIIGELVGLVRVISRALLRFGNKAYITKAYYFPGIMYLDLQHTLGMIYGLRHYDN
jgi:GT2 family glycosyltransferase